MKNDKPPSAGIVALPRAEIEARIAAISAELKRPMLHYLESLRLVEESAELRKALATTVTNGAKETLFGRVWRNLWEARKP